MPDIQYFPSFLFVYSRKVSIVAVIPTWTDVEVLYLYCKLSYKANLGLSNRELQNKHPEIWCGSGNRAKGKRSPRR